MLHCNNFCALYDNFLLVSQSSFKIYTFSACDKFIARKGEDRFLGGEWPNTADIEAYGILTTFNGTEVLDDICDHKPIFWQWFTSMKALVDSHHGRF